MGTSGGRTAGRSGVSLHYGTDVKRRHSQDLCLSGVQTDSSVSTVRSSSPGLGSDGRFTTENRTEFDFLVGDGPERPSDSMPRRSTRTTGCQH